MTEQGSSSGWRHGLPIFEALPGVGKEVERLRDEWMPDEVPSTVMMGKLGSLVVKNIDGAKDDDLERISAYVERALREGDEETQNAVATGFLESLMHTADKDRRAIRLLQRLGPEARAYCKAWDAFTGVKTPGI